MTVVKKLAAVLGSLAGLAVTANGYRPLSKRGYPSMYAFSFGVFASELPLQMIAAQFAALAAITRRLSPRLRRFSWLVSALSWVGLLGLHRLGRQANVPLTAALDAGLGTDRRTESADLWKRPAGAGTAKSPGVVRMLRIYRDYAHDTDISYGDYGARNHLDIWRRPDLDRGGRAPVLLQVPGGAWMVGSKRQQAYPLMSHLAELGWVCVAINYRLSPRSTWPDHIVDVKQALAWTKEHIAEYGGDPDWIAITGGSAGGHLSSLAALTANDPQFQPGFEDADTSVRAAVPFYGLYDFTRTDSAIHPLMAPTLAKYVFKLKRADTVEAFRTASPITLCICRCATVFRAARDQRLADPGRTGPRVHRAASRSQPPAGCLRRVAVRPARLRHLRVGAGRPCGGGRRTVPGRDLRTHHRELWPGQSSVTAGAGCARRAER